METYGKRRNDDTKQSRHNWTGVFVIIISISGP